MTKKEGFLSETLFHFLGTGDDGRLFDIFNSIVRRGLLLTVGNKEGKLDQFPVPLVDGQIALIELMQHARVCFTDIPEQHLSGHCEEYGEFGIGFARKTIPLRELLSVPLYMLWKIPMYLGFVTKPEKKWIRTDRGKPIDAA